MLSSKAFGIDITVNNIADTLNLATGAGTVNAANATLYAVTYSTDQAGDQNPVASLSAMNCTLSNQGATALFTQGQPCSAGETGSHNKFVVEVYGHYSCTLTNATGSTLIQGDFDGYKNLVDNCVGGGGQGGGGIVPIGL